MGEKLRKIPLAQQLERVQRTDLIRISASRSLFLVSFSLRTYPRGICEWGRASGEEAQWAFSWVNRNSRGRLEGESSIESSQSVLVANCHTTVVSFKQKWQPLR